MTLDYGYDPEGNRTSMDRQPGRRGQLHVRHAQRAGQRDALGLGDRHAEAVKFAYDNAGNMTGLTRYSNLAETTVVATSTSYTYDPANRLTAITDKNSGGTTLVSYGYTYDAAEPGDARRRARGPRVRRPTR